MYSPEEENRLFDQICERVTQGESITAICKPASEMLSKKKFYELLNNDEEKRNQYARACEARAEHIFEQVMVIADATQDDIIKDPDTGFDIVNHNVIQRDRLRVDARKWILSKMNPKKYGDKIQQEHSGDLGITWNETKTYSKPDGTVD